MVVLPQRVVCFCPHFVCARARSRSGVAATRRTSDGIRTIQLHTSARPKREVRFARFCSTWGTFSFRSRTTACAQIGTRCRGCRRAGISWIDSGLQWSFERGETSRAVPRGKYAVRDASTRSSCCGPAPTSSPPTTRSFRCWTNCNGSASGWFCCRTPASHFELSASTIRPSITSTPM